MRQPLQIVIDRPSDFWHVTVTDGLVTEDPDITDGKRRTYVEGEANWSAVAAALATIGRRLKSAAHDKLTVTVEVESEAEEIVLRSWFDTWQPVTGDPGFLEDGRRRLWKALRALPHVILPVRSEVLTQAALKTGPTARQVENILDGLDDDVWVLNQHLRPWFEARRS